MMADSSMCVGAHFCWELASALLKYPITTKFFVLSPCSIDWNSAAAVPLPSVWRTKSRSSLGYPRHGLDVMMFLILSKASSWSVPHLNWALAVVSSYNGPVTCRLPLCWTRTASSSASETWKYTILICRRRSWPTTFSSKLSRIRDMDSLTICSSLATVASSSSISRTNADWRSMFARIFF